MAKGLLLKGKNNYADDGSGRGKLLAPGAPIVEARSNAATFNMIKTVFLLILGFLLVSTVIYTLLGSTLMSAIPQKDGYVWVQHSTFNGGIPQKGDYIYASTTQKVDPSMLGKLKETYTGLQDAGVFQVIAGPYGNVTSVNNQLFIDNAPLHAKGSLKTGSITLNEEYLTTCVESTTSCKKGYLYVIPQDNISGEAKSHISKSGSIESFDAKKE